MKDNNSIDLSPAATTVAFDPVIPILRIPVQAGEIDDPSKGPYVLAFKDEDSWRRAWHACESKLIEQCEAGARMGCSVSASNKCKPPWWKNLFHSGKATTEQIADREACEDREMKACVVASRDTCIKYAKDTCRPTFANVRIAISDQMIDPRFTTHKSSAMKCWNDKSNVQSEKINKPAEVIGRCPSGSYQSNTNKYETTYRGSTLLGEASSEGHRKGPVWGEASIQGNDFQRQVDSFEGGLVRPKITPKQVKPSNDAGEDAKPGLPIWNYLQKQIISQLKDLGFLRKRS